MLSKVQRMKVKKEITLLHMYDEKQKDISSNILKYLGIIKGEEELRRLTRIANESLAYSNIFCYIKRRATKSPYYWNFNNVANKMLSFLEDDIKEILEIIYKRVGVSEIHDKHEIHLIILREAIFRFEIYFEIAAMEIKNKK